MAVAAFVKYITCIYLCARANRNSQTGGLSPQSRLNDIDVGPKRE